jgi:PAS domain S-box-containing protein
MSSIFSKTVFPALLCFLFVGATVEGHPAVSAAGEEYAELAGWATFFWAALLLGLSLIWWISFRRQVARRHRSEREHQHTLDSISCVVMRWNRDSLLEINRFGLDFFGYQAKELREKPVQNYLVLPSDAEKFLAGVRGRNEGDLPGPSPSESEEGRSESEDAPGHGTVRCRKKDGSIAWVSWTHCSCSNKRFEENGQMLSVGMDVTDQRKAEEKLRRDRDELVRNFEKKTGELKEHQERLNIALEAARAFVFELDLATDVNCSEVGQWTDLGYPESWKPEDFNALVEMLHSHERSQFTEMYRTARESVEDRSLGPYEVRLRSWDGHYLWFILYARVVHRSGGAQLVGIGCDIDEQKRIWQEMRRTERSYEFAQRAANVSSWEYLPDLEELNHSPQFERLTGFSPDEITSMGEFLARIHPEDHEQVHQGFEQLCSDQCEHTMEFRLLCKDGRQCWLMSLGCSKVDEEGNRRIFGITMDVTHKKEVEYTLREAKEKAEAAARSKTEFLANMSHEIRTPMNSIVGMLDLLKVGNLDEEQRDAIDTICTSTEVLMTVINDILDYSKIEAGKVTLEYVPIDLRQNVHDIAAIMKMSAVKKGIELLVDFDEAVPRWVRSDGVRLRQILLNLIGNAIKFTEKGSVAVTVRLESLLEEDDREKARVTFQVKDTGIGMTTEQLISIFEKFTQADASTTRKFGGTGLGLSICRELIGMMGGEIMVDSVDGEGATFWFTIDLEVVKQVEQEVEEPSLEPASSEKNITDYSREEFEKLLRENFFQFDMHALLVDDRKANQKVAQRILEKLGCRATVVSSGEEAVRRVREESFDLIFMDCQMPGMDGYEATRVIRREQKEGRHPLIVAMTANALEGARQECLDAGMDDYLAKPIKPQTVAAILQKYATLKTCASVG